MTTQNVPVARRIANISEHGTGVVQLVRAVWLHRTLSIELARRELTDLHAGHIGGFLWIVVHPFLMLMVYSFLFTIVLKVRIGNGGPADYTIYLFAGLAPWLFTQDVLTRSAYVMLSNIGIVKKVMFPTEALVAKTMLASVMAQSVLMVLVLLATMIVRGGIPPSFGLLL